MNAIDSGAGCLALSVLAMTAGLVCLLVLRRQNVAGERKHYELQSILRRQHDECARQIDRLARHVADLELCHQNIEGARKAGISRSRRSQAMELLRSGVSPESAASSLGMTTREICLIAEGSRMLALR